MSLTEDSSQQPASAWNEQGKGGFASAEQHGHMVTERCGRRAPSGAAGELLGAGMEGTGLQKQSWQLSMRSSNLSLVLCYPDSAPGCSLQVAQCPDDAKHC